MMHIPAPSLRRDSAKSFSSRPVVITLVKIRYIPTGFANGSNLPYPPPPFITVLLQLPS